MDIDQREQNLELNEAREFSLEDCTCVDAAVDGEWHWCDETQTLYRVSCSY